MPSLGEYLRDLRQKHGVSLEELSRSTRVAPRFLEALEADDLAALPAPAFTKGFIRAWCQVLRESADEALALYSPAERHAAPAVASLSTPLATTSMVERQSRSRGPVLVSLALFVVFGAALFVIATLLQSGRDAVGDRAGAPTAVARTDTPAGSPAIPAPAARAADAPGAAGSPPAASAATAAAPGVPAAGGPSADASVRATPPPSATPTAPTRPQSSASPPAGSSTAAPPAASAAQPAPPAPRDASADGGASAPAPRALLSPIATLGHVTPPYRVVARTSEPTWVRVRMADGATSEETIGAGQTREWVSNRPVVMTVGNAGGIALELNGQPLPALGRRGEVIPRLVLPPPSE